ncbi:hypothetical protein DRE_01450 [Drechslerella stenobrocha 248]|uniref:Uncharacterized protein n=1 Tax=Drechslerella stenobrocha 248 TaxID=1043628 RepID=W7HUQ9_9PEZI|nr:hypothetical protein DRE_01450 [Drechslerella stenobrocha 248]
MLTEQLDDFRQILKQDIVPQIEMLNAAIEKNKEVIKHLEELLPVLDEYPGVYSVSNIQRLLTEAEDRSESLAKGLKKVESDHWCARLLLSLICGRKVTVWKSLYSEDKDLKKFGMRLWKLREDVWDLDYDRPSEGNIVWKEVAESNPWVDDVIRDVCGERTPDPEDL